LLVGTISQKITAPLTMLFQGIIALIIAVVFANILRRDTLNKKSQEKLKQAEDTVVEKL
jgi:hypothetical protein